MAEFRPSPAPTHANRSGLRMLAVAAVVALVAVVAPASTGAQTNVTISDSGFASAIASALGESDGTTAFSTTALASITTLDADNESISSISGIDNLTGLKKVYLDDNSLTTADFSSNTKLQEIRISDNSLTSITLTGLNDLKKLYANNNSLTTVALPASNDEYLYVRLWGNNGLTSVTNQRYQGCEQSDTMVTPLSASDSRRNGCDGTIRMVLPIPYMTRFYKKSTEDGCSPCWNRLYRGESINGRSYDDGGTPDDDSDDYNPALVTVGPVRQGGA